MKIPHHTSPTSTPSDPCLDPLIGHSPSQVFSHNPYALVSPTVNATSTVPKYYTALKLMSKSHLNGRAAAEENFSEAI